MWSSTLGDIVFLHELSPPLERISFQYCPEDLNWRREGAWVDVPIVGRNNSKKHLTGGEDKLSLQLDFCGTFEDDDEYVIKQVTFLQSLTMLDGNDGPGRNVKLAWGNNSMFRHKVWIVKSVNSKLSDFNNNRAMNPMQAFVDLEMELDTAENSRIINVRLGSSGVRAINDSFTPNVA